KNDKEVRGMERKRLLLVEIVEYLSTNSWWNVDIMNELLQVLEYNLFRPLPTNVLQRPQTVKGDEEEEPFQDPRWPHLQLVYELCLRFLISSDIDKTVLIHSNYHITIHIVTYCLLLLLHCHYYLLLFVIYLYCHY
ncbi:Serine/threonine protein phosphatase 2A 59 kDa regulatory subunit B' eta isoform, partial [Reticulomyxa filosa]